MESILPRLMMCPWQFLSSPCMLRGGVLITKLAHTQVDETSFINLLQERLSTVFARVGLPMDVPRHVREGSWTSSRWPRVDFFRK